MRPYLDNRPRLYQLRYRFVPFRSVLRQPIKEKFLLWRRPRRLHLLWSLFRRHVIVKTLLTLLHIFQPIQCPPTPLKQFLLVWLRVMVRPEWCHWLLLRHAEVLERFLLRKPQVKIKEVIS